MSAERMFDGRVDVHVIPEIRALDIDTLVDFKFAEFLLCEGISLADG
jgi:CMP-N-acetylneuraminic acid synthetase